MRPVVPMRGNGSGSKMPSQEGTLPFVPSKAGTQRLPLDSRFRGNERTVASLLQRSFWLGPALARVAARRLVAQQLVYKLPSCKIARPPIHVLASSASACPAAEASPRAL